MPRWRRHRANTRLQGSIVYVGERSHCGLIIDWLTYIANQVAQVKVRRLKFGCDFS